MRGFFSLTTAVFLIGVSNGDDSQMPSSKPTSFPSMYFTSVPSSTPTRLWTPQPSSSPTADPSQQPTLLPTLVPTPLPSNNPTQQPSPAPYEQPTFDPISEPTNLPSQSPISQPSLLPTLVTTTDKTPLPSTNPTQQPSPVPSEWPTLYPIPEPSNLPSQSPISQPSLLPTLPLLSECVSNDCELILGVGKYQGPKIEFLTRGFNGGLVGPTIRVKAGDSLRINLINSLEDIDNINNGAMNSYRHANTTGLHLHGLHIGSAPPGDDIFTVLTPGTTQIFEYDIPSFHMAGTFWYHPHHHGSTSLQLGGGAMGMLIVEELPGEIPSFISEMAEKNMVIAHLDVDLLGTIQGLFNNALLQKTGDDAVSEIMIVNGVESPLVTVQAEVWERWRIVFSSMESFYTFSFDNPVCSMQLLAKDGVFLDVAPRDIQELPLYGGARCDILVKCSESAVGQEVHLVAFPARRINSELEQFNGTVLRVGIAASADPTPASVIPEFKIHRPCYLANTLDVANVDARFNLILNGGGDTINGERFSGQGEFITTFPSGSLIEIEMAGVRGHPLHTHINHFQVVEISDYSDYIQPGDWHDTLLFEAARRPVATIRLFTDTFMGSMVLHCHSSVHGDLGMMAEINITKSGSTTYEGAEVLEPTCYRGSSGRGFTLLGSVDNGTTPTSFPSSHPTSLPSSTPTRSLTPLPFSSPTADPSQQPTQLPTLVPTPLPSTNPTQQPSPAPSERPTLYPISKPTKLPTQSPISQPMLRPTHLPTSTPQSMATGQPSTFPLSSVTDAPTGIMSPSPTISGSIQDQAILVPNTGVDDGALENPNDESTSTLPDWVVASASVATLVVLGTIFCVYKRGSSIAGIINSHLHDLRGVNAEAPVRAVVCSER